jgi:hypothetical protein
MKTPVIVQSKNLVKPGYNPTASKDSQAQHIDDVQISEVKIVRSATD